LLGIRTSFPLSDQPSNATIDFAQSDILDILPDGFEAIKTFEMAIGRIYQCLGDLAKFLTAQGDFCQQCLDAIDNPKTPLTLKQTQKYADIWEQNQTDIKKAIMDITRVCNAIMIEALGTPLMQQYGHPSGRARSTSMQDHRPTSKSSESLGFDFNINFRLRGSKGGH
jgi:hypothetical protein